MSSLSISSAPTDVASGAGGPERCKQSLVLLHQDQQSLQTQQEWYGLVNHQWWYLCPCCPPFYFMQTFIIVLFVNVKTFRKLSKYLVCLGELLNRNCLSSNTQECLFTAKVKLKSLMSCTKILWHDTARRICPKKRNTSILLFSFTQFKVKHS